MKKNTLFKIIFSFFMILFLFMLSSCHEHISKMYECDDEYHFHVCETCGEVYDRETHVFDEVLVLEKPTEKKTGRALYTCGICGYEKEVIMDKLPHIHLLGKYEYDNKTHYQICEKCKEKVNLEEHTFGPKETSEEDGVEVIIQECTICGFKKISIASLDEKENAIDYVSNIMYSDTIDILPNEIDGKLYEWSSSDTKLYKINGIKAYTSRRYQTHQNQKVTVSVKEQDEDGNIKTYSKEITIAPVKFDDMVNPKAVYYSAGTDSTYRNNSTRYKSEGTLFSKKFRENMDMVYYAFATPNEDGTMNMGSTALNEIMALKEDGIRVLLVIGGVSSANLKALTICANDDTLRAKLVSNMIKLVKDNNFDGLDMDWEYPGTSGLSGYTTEIDKVNLNKLMRDLREGLDSIQDEGGSPYILSAAIPATSWGSARYQFKKTSKIGGLNDYCDYINMMSYDSNNPSYCTHLAPLYSSTQSNDYKFGCVYGTNQFVNLGLDKNKIIIGAAAYGKAYKVSGSINQTRPGLNNSGTLTIIDGLEGSFKSGTVYYSAIKVLLKDSSYKKYSEKNGSNFVGSYLYNSSNNIFITYESTDSIIAKCKFAKDNGLGIMVWAYGEDATDTIVDTICDNL